MSAPDTGGGFAAASCWPSGSNPVSTVGFVRIARTGCSAWTGSARSSTLTRVQSYGSQRLGSRPHQTSWSICARHPSKGRGAPASDEALPAVVTVTLHGGPPYPCRVQNGGLVGVLGDQFFPTLSLFLKSIVWCLFVNPEFFCKLNHSLPGQ